MAWYSLWKWFSSWRKREYINVIEWYSNILYEEWFCSLTPEKQQVILASRKRREQQRRKKIYDTLAMMTALSSISCYGDFYGK